MPRGQNQYGCCIGKKVYSITLRREKKLRFAGEI